MTFQPQNEHTIRIVLPDDVLDRTREFAGRIELANRRNKRQNKQGLTSTSEESLASRISGYAGEAALATYLGFPSVVRIADEWRHRPDVGPYNVMTTKRLDGKLIVTPRDPLYTMKALVVDCSPTFWVCGWFWPWRARDYPEWWDEPRRGGGSWFVPQSQLVAIELPDTRYRFPNEETEKEDWRTLLRRAGAAPPNT